MLMIQCKEEVFAEICEMMSPYEPELIEENGTGYINCFDKDWIFVIISHKRFSEFCKKIAKYMKSITDEQFILADSNTNRIIQQSIGEGEQYIFCRKTGMNDKHEILHAATTYITFRGEQR